MKRRSRILAALTAGVMAAGAMCFGFAQWSTDIGLTGSVSAAGSWDVAVTDAAVTLSSKGAEIDTVTTEATYDVVLYDVYVDYMNGYYHFRLDDENPKTVSMTGEEFAPYAPHGDIGKWIGIYKVNSGTKTRDADYTLVLNCKEEAKNIVEEWYNRSHLKATDGGIMDGQCIGTAAAWCYKGFSTNVPDNENIILTCGQAEQYFKDHPNGETVPGVTAFTADSVTYAPVSFFLPGAWAQYSVTITNRGSANANLDDYALALDNLGDLYQVDMPEFGEDEMLAPGESCTVQFVISVDADESFQVESQAFTMHLTYAQDAVEEAPAASHTHTAA